jgi:hypothetical protein
MQQSYVPKRAAPRLVRAGSREATEVLGRIQDILGDGAQAEPLCALRPGSPRLLTADT